ncbi:MAG: aminofutalosine synthase MqnE [Deltaproteobacteria bacterium]|nr:aminofutalosine synthase MqnE [Deltaproteobacteria bacterium]
MNRINFKDKKLLPVWDKIQKGKRLSLADGLVLFHSSDLISIGKMAGFVHQRLSGDAVYFALNQKIEPSNICALACRFCNFSARKGEPQAYEMNIEEILGRIKPDVREVHITGSLNPHRKWEYYLGMVGRIKQRFPQTDIKAFTAIEIDFFHKQFKLPVKEILKQLKAAGVDALPGGGAEVFSERVRKKLFPKKIGASAWLQIHAAAHRLGIPTNATMLYGHIETYEERLRHLIMLRDAQDKTGGFLAFVPLAFQPGTTGIKPSNQFGSAIDDLKTIAVSRLMLDNFPHIKAYWVMLTEDVAAAALNFGADDLDGTVGGERIAHDAGAITPPALAKDRLIKIIKDAGKIPVERDALYHPLDIYADNVIGKIPYLNSVLFYNYFEKERFKLLPIVPRRMGILSLKGKIAAGLFSLMDYLAQEDTLELMDYCIAARNQVKSVMLFSSKKWPDLAGKDIGITDDTATSVHLLRVLLEKKYGIKANLVRMQGTARNDGDFAAVLLIGDEAMRCKKYGLAGFEQVFDLATEWYHWQRLPFVFAVWAERKALSPNDKKDIHEKIRQTLAKEKRAPSPLSTLHGQRIGLTPRETKTYLDGFTFRLGKPEMKAIEIFRKIVADL